jgi:WD40 repeat protein
VNCPFETDDDLDVIRFSPDSKKLAVESHVGKCLEVWDVHTQKLDARVGKKGDGYVTMAPIFWTKKGTILAVFNFDFDDHDSKPTTIYEFDASTLETVGDPFQGHTDSIRQLALSFDGTLLSSSSFDDTIKLWSLEPHQLLASFHVQYEEPSSLIFSPDTRQLAYLADHKIFICNTPPSVLTSIKLAADAQAIVRTCCIYLIIDVLISSSRHLTIQPSMTYSMCTPHCFIHSHY